MLRSPLSRCLEEKHVLTEVSKQMLRACKHGRDDERGAGVENSRVSATVSTTIPTQDVLFPKQEETYVHRILDDFCYSNREIWRSISQEAEPSWTCRMDFLMVACAQ
jgi:hypothetical protein